ncbi:MAG: hypothetical protein KAY37_07050 [Phycisphaerae bacterium]|nr:hypothetical protein [Phycisphaerae bacterium]
MSEQRSERFQAFVDWCNKYVTGDKKGQAQIFLDRQFRPLDTVERSHLFTGRLTTV